MNESPELTKQEIVQKVTDIVRKSDLSKQANSVLTENSAKLVGVINQNLTASLNESIEDKVDSIVSKTGDEILALSQAWVENNSTDFTVFPVGTRYIHKDGDLLTLIVEQAPQIRNLLMFDKIFYLSIPYVQFVVTFKNGEPLRNLCVSCTKKPIVHLDQVCYHLPLPNISGHGVCVGNSVWTKNAPISDIIDSIIGSFWQSMFNSSSIEEMCLFFAKNFPPHLKGKTIESLNYWEDLSRKDELFAINKQTVYHQSQNLRQFIKRNKSDPNSASAVIEKLKSNIYDNMDNVGKSVKTAVLEKAYLDVPTKNLQAKVLEDVLKKIISASYEELWEYLKRKQSLEIELVKKKYEKQLEDFKADLRRRLS